MHAELRSRYESRARFVRAAGHCAVLLAAALTALSGCSGEGEPEENRAERRPDRPSFIVWMVDTLRADALGCYGRENAHTPAIDRFADESRLYTQASAPAPYTRATVASFFSGVPTSIHRTAKAVHVLNRDLPLMQERLQQAGYVTGAIVANPNAGSPFGFDRGFDHFEELYKRRDFGPVHPNELIVDAMEVADRTISWLETVPRDKPFFLFVLSVDPHGPHTPPPALAELHGAIGPSPMDGSIDTLVYYDKNPEEITDEIVRRLKQLYAAEVTLSDRGFERMLEGLDRLDLASDTVVSFTSDHGEEFFEHGKRGHGKTVYEESIRIPLIVRDPTGAIPPGRDDSPRSLYDLTEAIFALSGAESIGGGWGLSLTETETPEDRAVWMEQLSRGAIVGLRVGHHKLIRDIPREIGAVFDLELDPRELAPQGRDHPMSEPLIARFERIAEAIAAVRTADPESADIPTQDLEVLRALGYVD